jgi:hypothetical protein
LEFILKTANDCRLAIKSRNNADWLGFRVSTLYFLYSTRFIWNQSQLDHLSPSLTMMRNHPHHS